MHSSTKSHDGKLYVLWPIIPPPCMHSSPFSLGFKLVPYRRFGEMGPYTTSGIGIVQSPETTLDEWKMWCQLSITDGRVYVPIRDVMLLQYDSKNDYCDGMYNTIGDATLENHFALVV